MANISSSDVNIGSYVAVAPPVSTACAIWTRKDIHSELVRAAVLAPSPDNNQPWRFAAEGDRLVADLDPARSLPSDVNGMFDLVALGAAVENACIAARQAGMETNVEYRPGAAEPGLDRGLPPAWSIELQPGGQPDPLFPYLTERCTNRKLYATRPVPEQSLASIARAAEDFSETQLDWATGRPEIRALARLVAATDLFRFQYEPFHDEVFRQLRFSAEEAEETRDGLDVRTLELPPGAAAVFRRLRPWKRMKLVHTLRLGGLLALPSFLSVLRSGAIGMLSLSEPTPECFFQGGRAFQRIWLAAQAEGLSLHPLGSPAILLAQLEQLEGRNLTAAHQRLAARVADRLRQLAPATDGRTILVMFRLGYAAAPRFRALRRPVELVLPPG